MANTSTIVPPTISVGIKGNITDDLTLNATPQGVPVCTFSVAENHRKFDSATNQWQDAGVTFWRVTTWRRQAQNAAASFHKGDAVIIAGRFTPNAFLNKEGHPQLGLDVSATDVSADLNFATVQVTKNPRDEQTAPQYAPQAQQAPAPQQTLAPQPETQQAPAAGGNMWG